VTARRRRRAGGVAARVGDVLPRVLSRLGLAEDLDRWRAVVDWDRLVGPSLGRYAKAVRVEGDVLVVEAESSTALFHVKHFEKDLLARVQSHLRVGTIRSLRFDVRRS
jgi:predicted nucleic acid-binding Zn ribbon protein